VSSFKRFIAPSRRNRSELIPAAEREGNPLATSNVNRRIPMASVTAIGKPADTSKTR
jgi:hypothetical protein